MTSVYTILHPTDFSRCAGKAFQAACALARDCGAQLIVLHVLEPVRISAERRAVELFSPAEPECWEVLGKLRTCEPDVWIEPLMRKGAPVAEILALASNVPCDLIVMGMHGHAEEALPGLGTVAAAVTRLAGCPVLAVKLPWRAATRSHRERRRTANLRPTVDG